MANYEITRQPWVKLTIGGIIVAGMTLASPAGLAVAAPGSNQGDNGNHGQGNSGDNGNHGQGNGGQGTGSGSGGGDPGSGDPGAGDPGGGDPGTTPGRPEDPGDPGVVAASSDILVCAPDLAVQTPCLDAPPL